MSRWVLASGNQGKLREFVDLLAPRGIEVVPQAQFLVEPVDESAPTFVENALLKARAASAAAGLPALADDSGLCVEALEGAPGVRSARFAGNDASDAQNNALLLESLRETSERGAFFYCVLVLLRTPDDPTPLICEGRWQGSIVEQPRGADGFGYDPLFADAAGGKTAAELGLAGKRGISHRAKALRELVARLAEP